MWWKIYWWLMIILTAFAVLGIALGQNSLFDLFAFADGVVAVIGLYAFVFKKKIFNSNFWFYFFWFNVIYDLAFLAYGLAPNDPVIKNLAFLNTSSEAIPPILILIFSLLDIPMLYAFYKLAHPSKK